MLFWQKMAIFAPELREIQLNKFEKTLKFISSKITNDSPFYGKIFLVGGCVRDELLGERYSDLDLLINLPNGQKAFVEHMCASYPEVCKGPFYYQRYGTTAMDVVIDGAMTLVECVEPHIEEYDAEGKNLLETRFCTLEEDALRRDYTCNALYKNLSTGEILDPTGLGITDLNNKLLRTPREPNLTYRQDPVRMMRGIRFKHQKGFYLHDEAWEAIIAQHNEMQLATPKRLRDELNKLLKARSFADGIDDLLRCGLLKFVFPGLEEPLANNQPLERGNGCTLWQHTHLAMIVQVREHPHTDSLYKLAALLCDVADIYGTALASDILREAQVGREKVASIIHTIQMYQRFRSFFVDGQYIGRPRQLPHFIIGLGNHRDDFRRLVRALNHGLSDEHKLPYKLLYDNTHAPLPTGRSSEDNRNRNHWRNVRRREQRKKKRMEQRAARSNEAESQS